MRIDPDEMICVNCVHRDYGHETFLPVRRAWGMSLEACCPCLAEACDCDAGACVPMLAEDGHCRFHDEAFQPCDDFLDLLQSREEEESDFADMGDWNARLAAARDFAGL